MKQLFRFLVPLLIACACAQARQIQVKAVLTDVAAGTEAPATVEKLSKMKGVDLLSAPTIIVAEEKAGKIEVTQSTPVPGGGATALGVSLEVKTRVTEKGNIWFSGMVTDRSRSGGQKAEQLETSGFATRELYFSGWTTNGGTAILRTAPASRQQEKEGKAVAQVRELLVYLTFQKVEEKPAVESKKGKAAPATKKAPAKPKGKKN